MAGRFAYFVIFAEMRTGSNFLEENLNAYPGLQCHGELFNPHFLGGPKKTEKFGISMQARVADPFSLIEVIKAGDGELNGFRFFHDHDPRILQKCVDDRTCAKVILLRNPVETYISREIVRQTQQWRLSDLKSARSAKATFEPERFAEHLETHQQFQLKLLKALQISGQTAFYLTYEDITDVAVVNGLARYLGVDGEKKKSVNTTKKQNPQPLSEKVVNFEDMQASLANVDYFALGQIPNFEPRRGASIPSYVTAKHTPLMFLPIASGPTAGVTQWLAELDEVPETELGRKYTQKTLRLWMRSFRGHRSFTVVRHPVARLHDAFVRHILMQGPETFDSIRQILRMSYALPIPERGTNGNYSLDDHRKAFLTFANFVKGNINGQTAIRIDPSWATQAEVLRGFNQFILPDHVFREDDLQADLEHLVSRYNKSAPKISAIPVASPVSLDDIYDGEIEAAVKTAYQRDYLMFGFGPWKS